MKRCKFACPVCSETYDIETYSIGMGSADEMRCERCGATAIIDVDGDRKLLKKSRKHPIFCDCGGQLSRDGPYVCPKCHNHIDLDEIKKQINWWGFPEGRPGVVMIRQLDNMILRDINE